MRGLGRRRVSDGPRGGGPRSGTAAAPVGSTRPSDPMRIGRRSFIRRAVPRAMVALSFIRANVLVVVLLEVPTFFRVFSNGARNS